MGDKKYRKISNKQLNSIIQAHFEWLRTDGKGGKKADLSKVELRGINLERSILAKADLHDACLSRADLSHAYLNGANLRGADLNGAILSGTFLEAADLSESQLVGADLSSSFLESSNLSGVMLNRANLCNANLDHTVIHRTSIRNSDLRGATLKSAWLERVDFAGSRLNGVDFSQARIEYVRVDSKGSLLAAKLDDINDFLFVEEKRKKREERADQLFDISIKGTVAFSLPEGFNPLKVAKALMLVSTLVEGVRLSYTADEPSDREIRSMVANPELWGAEQDKYAASIQSISKNSPIEIILSNPAAIGALIVPLASAAAMFYKTYADNKTKRCSQDLEHQRGMAELDLKREKVALEKWKEETEFQHKARELAMMRADRQEQARVPAEALNDFSSQNEELLAELSRHLRGNIDQMESRTELASTVVSRFQDHWLELVGTEWPPPKINGEPMPMPSDDYGDTPK